MPDLTSESTSAGAPVAARRVLAAAAALMGLLVAGAVVLWVRYGSAVFFETIRAGFTACFG